MALYDDVLRFGTAIDESGFKSGITSLATTGAGLAAKAGTAIGAAFTAAVGATIALDTAVIKQFGELEQNLGGSEAVFRDYADHMQKIGAEAYKNLGVSQSQYLATANKMGALFQGSGLEVEQSAELTEKALQRAADMASVMGIDMSVALESVAGAAKGNFTMMDNLGVAMNATNIEAYALSKGLDFVWDSASQAEKAEVAMQMFFENTEQYAGNFARESTQTVSGSIGLMKAALESLVAGLGNADADVSLLAGNLSGAIASVVTNITPIIENVATALPQASEVILAAFSDMMPAITQVVEMVMATTPEVVRAAISIIDGICDGLYQAAPELLTALTDAMSAMTEKLPQMLTDVTRLIMSAGPDMLDAVLTIVDELCSGFIDSSPEIFAAINDMIKLLLTHLPDLVGTAMQLVTAIVSGLADMLPSLLPSIVECVMKVAEALLGCVDELVAACMELIVALNVGFFNAMPAIIENLLPLFVAIGDAVINSLLAVLNPEPFAEGIANGLAQYDWAGVGDRLMAGLLDIDTDKYGAGFAAKVEEALYKGRAGVKNHDNGGGDGGGRSFGGENPAEVIAEPVVAFNAAEYYSSYYKQQSEAAAKEYGGFMSRLTAENSAAAAAAYKEFTEAWKTLDHEYKTGAVTSEEEYYRRRSELMREYNVEDTEESRGYFEQLYAQEQKFHGESEQAAKEAAEEQRRIAEEEFGRWAEGYEQIANEAQSAYDKIAAKQESFSQRLMSGTAMWSVGTDENGKTAVQLNRMDLQIYQLQDYERKLNELRQRGLSDGILDELVQQDVESGTAVADALLSQNQNALDVMNRNYETKQSISDRIAESFYADKVAAVKENFADKMTDMLAEIPANAFYIGEETAQAFADGMASGGAASKDALGAYLGLSQRLQGGVSEARESYAGSAAAQSGITMTSNSNYTAPPGEAAKINVTVNADVRTELDGDEIAARTTVKIKETGVMTGNG